uniref:Uncharacterized protein n=1 Tax=Solanum tuberosum TaxID=4113 RepID=M1DXL4_SOLTU
MGLYWVVHPVLVLETLVARGSCGLALVVLSRKLERCVWGPRMKNPRDPTPNLEDETLLILGDETLFFFKFQNPLKLGEKYSKICAAEGHSTTLVEIADQLGDSPFFWFIAFCALPSACLCPGSLGGISLLRGTVRRHTGCSFRRLFDPLPSGLRVLEQRAEYVPSATRQAHLAKLRLQFLRSFQPFCSFLHSGLMRWFIIIIHGRMLFSLKFYSKLVLTGVVPPGSLDLLILRLMGRH